MSATIRLDLTDFERRIERLKRPDAPIARAMNRSIESGRTVGSRLVSAHLGIPVSRLKKRGLLRTTQARVGALVATLWASVKRIPLIEFRARGAEAGKRQSRRSGGGVRAKLPTGDVHLPHAFIATMPQGHRGVFERRGKARLPIEEKRGPSVEQAYHSARSAVEARVDEQLKKNLQHEFERAFGVRP